VVESLLTDSSGRVKWFNGKPHTRNLVPGTSVYWEVLRRSGGYEYRIWDPKRSKLSAYLVRRGRFFPFENTSEVLYLGAASGTTVSHISDVSPGGKVFSVEVATKPFRDLLVLAEQRRNIIPILEDANKPETYERLVPEVDILYQDIAQRNQTEIFIKNSRFLKKEGVGYLMVKSRCIDNSKAPAKVFGQCEDELREAGFEILENVRLDPYEKDHAAIVVKSNR
jgi:fibrillarin-like pre-rRNA processing protein